MRRRRLPRSRTGCLVWASLNLLLVVAIFFLIAVPLVLLRVDERLVRMGLIVAVVLSIFLPRRILARFSDWLERL